MPNLLFFFFLNFFVVICTFVCSLYLVRGQRAGVEIAEVRVLVEQNQHIKGSTIFEKQLSIDVARHSFLSRSSEIANLREVCYIHSLMYPCIKLSYIPLNHEIQHIIHTRFFVVV